MSYELECITCGNKDSVESTSLCLPVPNRTLLDPRKIKNVIASYSKAVFFIVIFLDLFGESIDSLLTMIGNTENIVAIYICGNQFYNSVNNQNNVFHLSRRFITSPTTLHAIRAYQFASERLYQSGHKGNAIVCEQKSNDLKRWLRTNNKVEACDILIIPVNTDDTNLRHFQAELIDLCKDLRPERPDNEPRVCTIYDYFSPNTPNVNMSKEEQAFVNKQNEIVCSLLREKLATIRIYLIGNEENISNQWSQLMIENEPDYDSPSAPQYNKRCTFVEYEPVTAETIRKLDSLNEGLRRVKNAKRIRLDQIRADGAYLLVALEDCHITAVNRERDANYTLSLETIGYHEKSTEYSNEFHTIEEAQNGPMDRDGNLTGEMDNTIQSDYRTDFED